MTTLFHRITALLTLFSISIVVHAAPVIIPAPPQLAALAYILIDTDTGKVIVEKNADQPLPPASMTKMMTSYIVSAAINRGAINPDDLVDISVKAWRKGGSKMFVREGTRVSVEDLLRGVIIQSGNDASIALAEHLAGSEEAFADVMNQQATLLGMKNTNFKNATGWPDDEHVTTARDLAVLGRALIQDFPEHYKLYSEKYFSYNGINQANRNQLLFTDKTVDGIKTGHTEAAGYGLVASSKKQDMRLVSVVIGARSESTRASESQKLLSYGFRYYYTHKLYSANDVVNTAVVWKGKSDMVDLGLLKDIYLTIPRGSEGDLVATVHVDQTIEAPITQGQELGNVVVALKDEELLNIPVVALQGVEPAGIFSRMVDSVHLFFNGFLR
ncbi:serine-type D-Ala-D-Ala carboxypeptidase [Candidatus Endobugula sertula]|uniref:serine-type D-Ala-D-Ala carboxypeptidase n=1 Tax=Candidatus Endobugula sertula TaxID=62101 RepID=A0A1D2QT35_9GAMM|nr:serine-type D-Ala-D-Ala carboxypeptidase [Candidatus Endobugula sertula]